MRIGCVSDLHGGKSGRRPYPRRVVYQPGMRFFSYVIQSPADVAITATGRRYTRWKCLCDCGTEFETTTKQIRRGVRKSCGCASRSNRFVPLRTDAGVIFIKIISHYKTRAKRRGVDFALTSDQCDALFLSPCHYCGSPPCRPVGSYAGPRRIADNPGLLHLLVNGIDRIDSSLGYIETNVVPCCHVCNRAKGAMSSEEFSEWISRLVAKYGVPT